MNVMPHGRTRLFSIIPTTPSTTEHLAQMYQAVLILLNNMIPEYIIDLVVAVGYKRHGYYFDKHGDLEYITETDVLNPLFWQALGNELDRKFEESQRPNFISFEKWDWKANAYHFFGLLMSDGDTASFWVNLK